MRSVAMDVFAMPEVTVEGETYDCVILAVDRHSGYIVVKRYPEPHGQATAYNRSPVH